MNLETEKKVVSNSEGEQQHEESFLNYPCLWPSCFNLNHDNAQFEEKSKQEGEENIEMKVITSEQDISRQTKVTLTPTNSNRWFLTLQISCFNCKHKNIMQGKETKKTGLGDLKKKYGWYKTVCLCIAKSRLLNFSKAVSKKNFPSFQASNSFPGKFLMFLGV